MKSALIGSSRCPIDQDGQLNTFWPAEIVERVECSADGPPTEKNIVDQDNYFAGYVERDYGGKNSGGDTVFQVVPVHAHIQTSDRDQMSGDGAKQLAQPRREMNSAPMNPDHDNVLDGFIAFRNLMRDPRQYSFDRGFI
jgi:hypothetical protein